MIASRFQLLGLFACFVACAGGATPGSSPPGSGSRIAVDEEPSRAGDKPAMCGGITGAGCPAGKYCSFPPEARCGAADQTGTCAKVPEACLQQYDPVCGCDNKTYGNACAAAQASVSVARRGPCEPEGSAEATAPAIAIQEGELCGTRGVPGECAEGLFCAFDGQCGADDRGGRCKRKPEVCTKIYSPVCGCDGNTHPNACVAESQGVSVAFQGECGQR